MLHMTKLNKTMKKIISAILVIIMLISVFAPLKVKGEEITAEEYVKFSSEWTSSKTSQIDVTANGSTTTYLNFDLQLSGVSTGFQNMQLQILSKENDAPRPTITISGDVARAESVTNTSKVSIVNFDKSLNSGIQINGTAGVVFKGMSDFSSYEKEIQLILTGEYRNPVTKLTETFSKEITLTANVKTEDTVDGFSGYTELRYPGSSEQYKEIDGSTYNKYEMSSVTQNYYIDVESNNETYEKIEVEISRTTPLDIPLTDINSEENLVINTDYIKNLRL